MPKILQTAALLCCSNLLMAFAWYGPLKKMTGKPLVLIILVSWCIALFEYSFAVPANRISMGSYSVAHLKVLQECISLTMFVPFALFYLKERWNWNFLWAGLCLVAAVFFMFRKQG
ncbi:MAG: DMT family protein [Lentisphaeria bacterium]|nr:DMT family protein [Lentisphaeria bacterium]